MSKMTKRHHPLFIGENVFACDDNMCWAKIVELNRKNAVVENLVGDRWKTSRAHLYQIAKGIVDNRTKSAVCYEHFFCKGNNYPYYSPMLDENLFSFEVSVV